MHISRLETNARLSQAVHSGGFVFLSGQPADRTLGQGVAAQTEEILDRIDGLLAQAGSSKNAILSATILLKSIDEWGAMNEIWERWMPAGKAPARHCIETRFTPSDDYHVEILVTAAVER